MNEILGTDCPVCPVCFERIDFDRIDDVFKEVLESEGVYRGTCPKCKTSLETIYNLDGSFDTFTLFEV